MTVDHLASASLYIHMNANARGTTHITTCAHELHSTPPSAFPALLSRETQRRSLPACVERTTAGERRGHRAAGPYSHLFIQPSQRTRAERVRQVPGPALPRVAPRAHEKTRRVGGRPRPRARPARCGRAIGRHATRRESGLARLHMCICMHKYVSPVHGGAGRQARAARAAARASAADARHFDRA